MPKTILIISTSAVEGIPDAKTGCWLEEVAAPYNHLTSLGYEVMVSSVAGGAIPWDAGSCAAPNTSEDTEKFLADEAAQAKCNNTVAASTLIADAKAGVFSAVFFPGGHGTCFDFPDNAVNKEIAEAIYSQGGIVSAVCHGPCALKGINDPATGEPIVKGKKCTGFSNVEEDMVGLTGKVPILTETSLREAGGLYECGDAWGVNAVVDGKLITGQNPASSKAVAEKIAEVLGSP